MQHLYIRLTTLSPLAIRSDHAPGGAVTANYIPCTTFIGALAEAHRLLRPNKVDEFAQWFLHGQVLFPNLYPANFDDPDLQNRNVPVYPVPRTAQTCKRHSGFLFPVKEENDAHGVRDSLIDWALFELGRRKEHNPDNADPLEALKDHKECWCGERMDSLGGFYRRNDVVKKQLIAAKERKRLRTHSGIDRASGTVQEGILFNRQVFEEGMRFWGMAKFADDEQLISKFTRFINELGSERLLRIGTGRTRGMGKVTINVEQPIERPKEPLDPFKSFQKRLNKFDELLHERAQPFNLHNLQNKFFFALTLHSPMILQDELLRYQGNIDAATLERLLKERLLKEKLYDRSIPGLERIYQNARLRRVAGWQELWGVPRTSEYAIEAGSVFLFTCSSKPDDALYKALFTLEEQGIGKRLAEGFGRVSVSDQFHQEIELL